MFTLSDTNVELSKGASICRGFELNTSHKEMVWNNMVEEASTLDYETWVSTRIAAEDEILTLREKDGQEVRLKNGKFVIKKAYESGVTIEIGMGKTATERAAITPDERVKKAIRVVLKNYPECSPEVQEMVQEMCSGLVAPF